MSTCVLRCYATSTVFILKLLDFFYERRLQRNTYNGDFGKQVRGDKKVPLQWCNQLLQSMEEGHRKAKCVQL